MLSRNTWLLMMPNGQYPHSVNADALKIDHCLSLGGGICITSLPGWLSSSPSAGLLCVVQMWDKALVEEMSKALGNIADKQMFAWKQSDNRRTHQKWANVGYKKVKVVACGSTGIFDDVRVVRIGLERVDKTAFELYVVSVFVDRFKHIELLSRSLVYKLQWSGNFVSLRDRTALRLQLRSLSRPLTPRCGRSLRSAYAKMTAARHSAPGRAWTKKIFLFAVRPPKIPATSTQPAKNCAI